MTQMVDTLCDSPIAQRVHHLSHTLSLSKDNEAVRRRLRRRIANTWRKPPPPTKLAKESDWYQKSKRTTDGASCPRLISESPGIFKGFVFPGTNISGSDKGIISVLFHLHHLLRLDLLYSYAMERIIQAFLSSSGLAG